MISKQGQPPISPGTLLDAVRQLLIPRAFLICPNLAEAEALTGLSVHTEDMARGG